MVHSVLVVLGQRLDAYAAVAESAADLLQQLPLKSFRALLSPFRINLYTLI